MRIPGKGVKSLVRLFMRGYFWRVMLFVVAIVVVAMIAINVLTSTLAYMIGHAYGVQHEREKQALVSNVFSDYLAADKPFCVDPTAKPPKVDYAYRSSYNTYTMKRPVMDPKATGIGGRER
jgi:hypothetical protein